MGRRRPLQIAELTRYANVVKVDRSNAHCARSIVVRRGRWEEIRERKKVLMKGRKDLYILISSYTPSKEAFLLIVLRVLRAYGLSAIEVKFFFKNGSG